MTGGQQHDGFIKPGGEIRGLCGSPHIVIGAFQVSGPDSPVLAIAAEAAVRVAANGLRVVSYHGPVSLQVNSTVDKPVVFSTDSQNPTPGFWSGIPSSTLSSDGQVVRPESAPSVSSA